MVLGMFSSKAARLKREQDRAFASLVASGYLSSSGHISITGAMPYCSFRNNWNATNVADLEAMSALPPFTYWQRRSDGPNKRWEWVPRLEGNLKLGASSEARSRQLAKCHEGGFCVVTAAMLAAFNTGPERTETFDTHMFPSGRATCRSFSCGLAGGQFAPAPLVPKGEHGSSSERSADDYLRSRRYTASSDTRKASPGRDALAKALRGRR